jgi:hypothetical protein
MANTNRARAAVNAILAPDDDPLPAADVVEQPSAELVPLPVAKPAQVATRASMGEKIQYARALAEASLLPRAYQKQPGNVLLAVEMGEALGLHPYVAINGIHVIEGKPTGSAALISALVRRAGHRLRVRGTDKEAVAQIVRHDDPDFTYESKWDLDRARTAGLLGKDVWKKFPAAMLKARAITEVARDACQEALSGIQYTPEELGASVDGDGDMVAPPAVQLPVATVDGRDWYADVDLCTAVDELRELYRQANAAGELTDKLATAISSRAAELVQVDTTTGEVLEPSDAEIAAMASEMGAGQ